MINLLPYDTKKQIRAARTNVILLRYIIILGFSAGFLVLVCVTTYFFINFNKTSKDSTVDTNVIVSPIQKQISDFRTDLGITKQILNEQVSYTNILTGIAAALPAGAILDNLKLDDSSFGSSTDLQILAKTSDIEKSLRENFENSPLFSNYKLISTVPSQGGSTTYPFTINISVTINKGIAR